MTAATATGTSATSRPRLSPAWSWAVRLHVGYLALFTVWAAWVSSAYPKFVEEARLPVWPPSTPLGAWLERVVLLPLYRYDVIWYVGIARDGYGAERGDITFHPLYPLLAALLGRLLGGQYLLAAWLVSQVCCVAMLALLYKLVALDEGEAVARRATLLLLGSPLGFTFLLPYTESLLLLGVAAALYAARRGRWWLAGLAAAAAALTKQPGALVLLPLLWELWHARRATVRARGVRPLLGPLAGLALTPLALLSWIVYRARLGDASFRWDQPLGVVNRVLLSPAYERVWGHSLSWPGAPLAMALQHLAERPMFYLWLNVLLVLLMSALTLVAALRARRSYALFALAVLLLRLAIVYPPLPLMAAARHLTLIFPIFIQLARWCRRPAVAALVLTVNALLWALIGALYVRNAFVP
ncbi:MAG TPA: glycosyltransferase family 39 protein [Roseiflexaceae bacterium]|nr:glycosyltransferase family 39 protein [Roseiflexaceae bacterium]